MKIFNLPRIILDNFFGKMSNRKRYKKTIKRLTYLDIDEKNRKLIKQIYKLDFELYDNIKKLGS